MSETKQYVDILIDSLEKKKKLLELIVRENEEQSHLIKNNMSIEEFDQIVEKKDDLIKRLTLLDSGFERIYGRVKDNLNHEKASFSTEIARMKDLISKITELSVGIQAAEKRNKQLIENYFSYTRGKLKQVKTSVKVANKYYRSMSGSDYQSEIRQIDKKK